MAQQFKNSIVLRMGLSMAIITLLGFLTMLGSVIIEEMTQGHAAAINQAGTLRMQSYRIATRLVYQANIDQELYWKLTDDLVREFEQRLTNPRLTTVIPDEAEHALRKSYNRINLQWHKKIKPVLNVYVGLVAPKNRDALPVHKDDKLLWLTTQRNIRERYVSIVDRFVSDIDNLVKQLEEGAESKIRWLRVIQINSLFLTLGMVFYTMYLVQAVVLPPLRDLLRFSMFARRGDFSVRVKHEHNDELGQLGSAFNGMADDLSKMYADLEERVREKTTDLERSNRSLELLYKTTSRLNDTHISAQTYEELLKDIEQVVGFGPGNICLAKSMSEEVFTLASSRPQGGTICSTDHCKECMHQQGTQIKEWKELDQSVRRVLSIPIRDQDEQHGILFIAIPEGTLLKVWQKQLLEAVADHIGAAIGVAYRTSFNRRLALHEERGVIARELHDSLAQSLSYLKIQVSRLDMTLKQQRDEAEIQKVVQEIREGLNSAYRQLRELLTTFRLKVDDRGLLQALEDTVHEYQVRSDISIKLEFDLHGMQLSENEEIHVLQVIREALSNVIRHSGAKHARVTLTGGGEMPIRVSIIDDGCGIPSAPERSRHYGLAIMDERVRSLGGSISVEPAEGSGTQVVFEFMATKNENNLVSDKVDLKAL
ncbi:histidine kinase [Sedimenticola selenatireducens]|uniref:Sensor protein n=1 Tax=Sedimenticola selenatireducens TaxID=191960 RepID=A0A557SJW8_9GAMM|nr:histidine kinase [Sedimenticola selenatireducens]TVO77728.1 HAMP domain-containing protein [Sedimenticola selenatireducens]TVT65034.1 MAG: HAMP domain-containing protein [Sedimenticola selenatireducens]